MRGRTDSRLGGPDVLLLGSIVGLPWAFGGVEVWAYRAAAFLIAAAWEWHVIRFREGAPLLPAGATAWLFPAAALIAWAGFQAQPLPAAVVRVLSPAAAAVQRDAPAGTIGELEAYALGHLPGDLPPAPEGGGAMPEAPEYFPSVHIGENRLPISGRYMPPRFPAVLSPRRFGR